MKHALILGKRNEVTYSIMDALELDFKVKQNDLDEKAAKNYVDSGIYQLVVINLEGISSEIEKILHYAKDKRSEIPIVIICKEDIWEEYIGTYEFLPKILHILRPASKEMVRGRCNNIVEEWENRQGVRRSDKKKILVIDDSAIQLRSVKSLLEKKYDVSIAISGELGVRMAEEQCPDVILLDYLMPYLDGIGTYELIRNTESCANVPIIFMTGVSDRNKIVEALKLAPFGYVLKPIQSEKMMNLIEKALRENR